MNLDGIEAREPLALEVASSQGRSPAIVVALFVALLAHLLAVSLIDWPKVDVRELRHPVLKVSLNRILPTKLVEQPNTVRPEPRITEPKEVVVQEPIVDVIEYPEVNYSRLTEQVRTHERERSDRKQPRIRRFTTDDFPKKAEPVSTATPWRNAFPVKRQLARGTSPTGFVSYAVTDSKGRITCLQQRGDPANPESWMWYRVPGELCGHLQQPAHDN